MFGSQVNHVPPDRQIGLLEFDPLERLEDLGRDLLEGFGLRVHLPPRLAALCFALEAAEPGWLFRNEGRLEPLDRFLKPPLDHPTLDLLLGEDQDSACLRPHDGTSSEKSPLGK